MESIDIVMLNEKTQEFIHDLSRELDISEESVVKLIIQYFAREGYSASEDDLK